MMETIKITMKDALNVWAGEKQSRFVSVVEPSLAAGDEIRNKLDIQTPCGKYDISFRKCKDEKDVWSIELRYKGDARDVEDFDIMVEVLDNNKKQMLEARLSCDPFIGWLNLGEYDISSISVLPKRAEM